MSRGIPRTEATKLGDLLDGGDERKQGCDFFLRVDSEEQLHHTFVTIVCGACGQELTVPHRELCCE